MASSGRKQSTTARRHEQRPSIPSTSSENQQQTLFQLFSSRQQKPTPISQLPSTPSSKRKRPGGACAERDYISPTKSVSTTNMYNFATKAHVNGVIDLTSSPAGSPRSKQRRISVGAKVENAPSPHGPKKLAVKNFRTTARSDGSEYVARTTQQLRDALAAIYEDKRPALSNEELYKGTENLCRLRRAPELAQILRETCRKHILAMLKDLKEPLADVSDEKDVVVLRSVVDAWSTWIGHSVRPHTCSIDSFQY